MRYFIYIDECTYHNLIIASWDTSLKINMQSLFMKSLILSLLAFAPLISATTGRLVRIVKVHLIIIRPGSHLKLLLVMDFHSLLLQTQSWQWF